MERIDTLLAKIPKSICSFYAGKDGSFVCHNPDNAISKRELRRLQVVLLETISALDDIAKFRIDRLYIKLEGKIVFISAFETGIVFAVTKMSAMEDAISIRAAVEGIVRELFTTVTEEKTKVEISSKSKETLAVLQKIIEKELGDIGVSLFENQINELKIDKNQPTVGDLITLCNALQGTASLIVGRTSAQRMTQLLLTEVDKIK